MLGLRLSQQAFDTFKQVLQALMQDSVDLRSASQGICILNDVQVDLLNLSQETATFGLKWISSSILFANSICPGWFFSTWTIEIQGLVLPCRPEIPRTVAQQHFSKNGLTDLQAQIAVEATSALPQSISSRSDSETQRYALLSSKIWAMSSPSLRLQLKPHVVLVSIVLQYLARLDMNCVAWKEEQVSQLFSLISRKSTTKGCGYAIFSNGTVAFNLPSI